MQSPLSHSVNIYNELKERIRQAYGLEDEDPALLDTLEGETDLDKQIAKVLREAKHAEAMGEGLDEYMGELQARATRLGERGKRLRSIAAWAMQEAGLKKVEAPDMTVSLRDGKQKVEIAGEVPREFCRVKETLSPDKDAIREALESGKSLSFAYMSNPSPVLTVRVK